MYNFSQISSGIILLITDDENIHALIKSSLPNQVAELHHVGTVAGAVHLIDLLVPDLIIIDAETFSRDTGEYKPAFAKKQDILKISVLLIDSHSNEDISKWLSVEEIISRSFSPIEFVNRIKSIFSIRRLRHQIDLRDVVAMQIVSQNQRVTKRERILLVDDSRSDRIMIKKFFEQSNYDIMEAESGEEALDLIQQVKFDFVLLDVILPGMSGFEVCRHIKNNPATVVIPVVILTGLTRLDDRISALQFGADDFLTKPIEKRELLVRVEALLKRKRYQEQILQSYNSAVFQAITDGLTQLYNHRYFIEYLKKEIIRSERYQRNLSLLMIDVDYYKQYNDLNGHLAGDQALVKLAGIIRESIRNIDLPARYGGEEFMVILPETVKEQVPVVAERIRKITEKTDFPGCAQYPAGRLTISLGYASYPTDASSADELIHKSDLALYHAKKTGRNKVIGYFPGILPARPGAPGS